MKTAVITGAEAGLGRAIHNAMRVMGGYHIITYDRKSGQDIRNPDIVLPGGLDLLINCAGINKTGWMDSFEEKDWDDVMDINVKGMFLMTKHLLKPLGDAGGTVVNIVSNASHMPMTCSAAYNASKGAAHILTLQMARELMPRYGITVFGISPNKLAGTEMSQDIERQTCELRGWTPAFAAEYQRKALPAGAETPPERVGEFLAFLLSTKERHRYLHGTIIPYGA